MRFDYSNEVGYDDGSYDKQVELSEGCEILISISNIIPNPYWTLEGIYSDFGNVEYRGNGVYRIKIPKITEADKKCLGSIFIKYQYTPVSAKDLPKSTNYSHSNNLYLVGAETNTNYGSSWDITTKGNKYYLHTPTHPGGIPMSGYYYLQAGEK